MTEREKIKEVAKRLFGVSDAPEFEARELVASAETEETLERMLSRRIAGEPLQYIENTAYFMDFAFYVDENVLIPRQETELLCALAIEHIKATGNMPLIAKISTHYTNTLQTVNIQKMKKFKDKKFAAGCSRDTIREGAERLGWTLEELMEKTILAMRSCEAQVNAEMETL